MTPLAYAKLAGALALVLLVLYGANRLYDAGYAKAELKGQLEAQRITTALTQAAADEQLRQGLANRAAREAANAAITRMAQEAEAREATIKELADEAAADRNAARECLGADSVRRITKATAGR